MWTTNVAQRTFETFEILFTKILDFFNLCILENLSTNFAHLAIFQAIEFVDWPVPKTLDMFVCQISENKAFKMQHSVTVVCEERVHNLISSPVSKLSARTPSAMSPP